MAAAPSTTMSAPETTFDQIIPPVGETPRKIHGEMIIQTPSSGVTQVSP
jgi:hypothetical protein